MSQLDEDLLPSPGVIEEVRDFYDRYPYPRQIDSLGEYQRLWQDRQRRRADYHTFWPARSYQEDQSILIAGCGTSQAAKHALRWPRADVTAIDISATSVRCTEELKRRYKLENLQVHQLSIERINELGTNFDQIVCTGVLHHLADPGAGLNALRSVLKPDGAMHLMVYAPYGRTGIYMLQEFCRRMGIRATDEGIRELIEVLSWLPHGHPLENLLREAPDFRHEAALADALLHPQDRAYSVPQLFNLIEKAGLKFARWVRQAAYSIHCGAMAKIPDRPRLEQLSSAEQYAVVELFRGTMVRHSVIAHHDEDPGTPELMDFSDDACLGYIPIRMSDTICVQERLSPGAAAILINQTHTYKDLLMPIDSTEKCLFDCIDGNRCIAEIAERTLPSAQIDSQRQKARRFFERLWQYDHAVFDTSQLSTAGQCGKERVKAV